MDELHLMAMLLATGDDGTDSYTTRTRTKDAAGVVVARSKCTYHVIPDDTSVASRVRASKHGITANVVVGNDVMDATRTGVVAAHIVGKTAGLSADDVLRILRGVADEQETKRRKAELADQLRTGLNYDEPTATEQRAHAEPVKPEKPETPKTNGSPGSRKRRISQSSNRGA